MGIFYICLTLLAKNYLDCFWAWIGCRMVPFGFALSQIDVGISVIITQQWLGFFWIPFCAFWDPDDPLNGQNAVFRAVNCAKWSILYLKWAKLWVCYHHLMFNKGLLTPSSHCVFPQVPLNNNPLIKYCFSGPKCVQRSLL